MNVMWIYVSYALVVLASSYSCAKILGIVPSPLHSHQIAFAPLWKELSLRGHNVTVITTDPQNDSNLSNLTEIDLKFSYKYFVDASKEMEKITMWNAFQIFNKITIKLSEEQLSYPAVQNLMRYGEHFDVVLVEAICPEFLAFAELYNCPKIGILSLDAPSFLHSTMGNPSHPVLYPEAFTAYHGNLNFKERLISTIYSLYLSHYSMEEYYEVRQTVLRKFFRTNKTAKELLSDVDMLFVNANPILQGVRALGPSTMNIGDLRRTTSAKPLPRDLKDFLDGAKEGFIYFSLGSNVKSKDLKKETLEAIIETLKNMPYKVLWKFEADELPGKPDNVKLVKWTPQQSVLAHPNIKLFVTQGGLQSMEEAIFSEVPLVVIPFFGDQELNAKIMDSKGIAAVVHVRPKLDQQALETAMLEVLNNPRYRNAVKRLKQLALDTPMTGLEKAVWWTEYVIRNKGAKHLRNPAADIPFYQYYLIDVISFLLFVSVVVISVIVLSVRFLIRFISSKFLTSRVPTGKKSN